MSTTAISLARSAANGCAINGTFLGASITTTNGSTNGKTNGHTNLIHNKHTMSSNLINSQPLKNNTATAVAATTATITTTPTEINTPKGKKPELAAKIIKQSHIICFDVDSTVIMEEGIDELAEFCGKGNEVARVTKEAMGGAMTFQDALKIRLNIIRPTQKQIVDFVKLRPSTLTRNVKSFIAQLKADGKQVYLISGGFDCLIEPVANELGIPMSNLFANKLMFYTNGDYASFDTTQPTSKSGGKAEAISLIKQRHSNDALITMIGDGATDLEAVPPADYFIGFGGNVMRAEVFKRAQYYVTDFEQLM